MANLKKERQGYGYTYTDLAQVNDYIASNGWEYYQTIETTDEGVDYVITWINFHNDDKDTWEVRRGCKVPNATLSGKSNPAQEYGSALTYARRYSLFLAFGLATTDDDAACLTIDKTEARLNAKNEELVNAKIHLLAEAFSTTDAKIKKRLEKENLTSYEDKLSKLDEWLPKKEGAPVEFTRS